MVHGVVVVFFFMNEQNKTRTLSNISYKTDRDVTLILQVSTCILHPTSFRSYHNFGRLWIHRQTSSSDIGISASHELCRSQPKMSCIYDVTVVGLGGHGSGILLQ